MNQGLVACFDDVMKPSPTFCFFHVVGPGPELFRCLVLLHARTAWALELRNMKNHADEHEAFAASRSSEHVYVPIDDSNFTTLDKHAETIEMDAKLPLVRARFLGFLTLCPAAANISSSKTLLELPPIRTNNLLASVFERSSSENPESARTRCCPTG